MKGEWGEGVAADGEQAPRSLVETGREGVPLQLLLHGTGIGGRVK